MSETPENREDEMQAHFDDALLASPELVRLYVSITEEVLTKGINGRPVIGTMSPDLPLLIIRATTTIGEKGENRFRCNNNHARFLADVVRASRTDLAPRIAKPRKRRSKLDPPVNRPPLGPDDFETDDK